MRGGPGNLKGCPWCRLSNAPMAVGFPARTLDLGYLQPVRQTATGAGDEEASAGALVESHALCRESRAGAEQPCACGRGSCHTVA